MGRHDAGKIVERALPPCLLTQVLGEEVPANHHGLALPLVPNSVSCSAWDCPDLQPTVCEESQDSPLNKVCLFCA